MRDRQVRVAGWAHSKFGRLDSMTLEGLIESVAPAALDHASIDPEMIDEVIISHYNHGMDAQGFPASLPIGSVPALQYKPSTHVENACASGSAAVHFAARAIYASDARAVLVIGIEKMTSASAETVRRALVAASHVEQEAREPDASFAGLFARIAGGYFDIHGDKSDALALIAAKNHANGALNPLAHMQKDLGYEFCATVSDGNPLVAPPLRRTDCSMVSDGAAALVLTRADVPTGGPDVRLRARAHVNDRLPMAGRDMTRLEGCRRAWALALDVSGTTLDDLDFVETHDCFTIAELIQYEAMGLAEPGAGEKVLRDGVTSPGGALPVNLSGGLKAKGHPIGATGVSMHVIAAAQLAGNPIGQAIPGARLGGVFNMGGAGVANYCSILERIS